jgi:hypothetical protein
VEWLRLERGKLEAQRDADRRAAAEAGAWAMREAVNIFIQQHVKDLASVIEFHRKREDANSAEIVEEIHRFVDTMHGFMMMTLDAAAIVREALAEADGEDATE